LTRTWVQANAVRTGRAGLCAQANNLPGPARPVDKWRLVRFLCTALRTAPGWRNRGQENWGQILRYPHKFVFKFKQLDAI